MQRTHKTHKLKLATIMMTTTLASMGLNLDSFAGATESKKSKFRNNFAAKAREFNLKVKRNRMRNMMARKSRRVNRQRGH